MVFVYQHGFALLTISIFQENAATRISEISLLIFKHQHQVQANTEPFWTGIFWFEQV